MGVLLIWEINMKQELPTTITIEVFSLSASLLWTILSFTVVQFLKFNLLYQIKQ